MTQPNSINTSLTQAHAGQPIRRTLIVTQGDAAGAVRDRLRMAFGEQSALTHAVALFDGDAPGDNPARALHTCLAGISRVGGRAALAAAGYALSPASELALLIVADVTGPAVAEQSRRLIADVDAIARDGWGLDSHTICIALAEDWTAAAAREGLKALATAVGPEATVIPLNRVNEQGLELDGDQAYWDAAAAIVEALAVTPLGDALYWAGDGPRPDRAGPSLTTVGLARWRWQPEAIRDQLAAAWRGQVLDQWLATADAAQALPVAQRAAGWFDARGLRLPALAARLERSVAVYDVPLWPTPYPWAAGAAVDRLRALSAAMAGGRGGAVALVLDEWAEWPEEQEVALRAEVAMQLNREPIAGLDLAGRFLARLAEVVTDAADDLADRQEELEEGARSLEAQVRTQLEVMDAIMRHWPAGPAVAWLGVLLRPWRWPSLVWGQWRVHDAARQLAEQVAYQAVVEREQVVVAAGAALYQRLAAAVGRVAAHVEEAADMFAAARAADSRPPDPPAVGLLGLEESQELAATEAAAAVGGLGQLAQTIDEAVVAMLEEVSRRRFQFVTELSAVAALERLLPEETVAGWWAARWAEATPLWLTDDAGQPEESRGAGRSWTVVCAPEIERLVALPGAAERAEWRVLPAADGRQILIMRWRTGVLP